MESEPTEQHRWLQKLIGEWEYEAECVTEPGQQAVKGTGRERVRALGDLWVLFEAEGEAPGAGIMRSLMTLGYDTNRKRFVGSWVCSIMAHMFVYEGMLDSDGRVLVLDTTGPAMDDPTKSARYQDVIAWIDDDHRVLRSRMPDEEGGWNVFMTARYTRVG